MDGKKTGRSVLTIARGRQGYATHCFTSLFTFLKFMANSFPE